MKHVNRCSELCHVHCSISPARIICPHLPDRFLEAAQHLRTFMLLPDLRLVQRKTELPPNRGRKAVNRSSESTSQTNLRGRSGTSDNKSIVCQNWHKAIIEKRGSSQSDARISRNVQRTNQHGNSLL